MPNRIRTLPAWLKSKLNLLFKKRWTKMPNQPQSIAPTLLPPNVGSALAHIFVDARARHPGLHESWIKASIALGGRLPASLLMMSIQRDGDVDMVLRSVEDEIQNGQATNPQDPILSPYHYLMMLSNYWVGGVYESLRLLRERKLLDEGERSSELFRAVELVRITIDKHEIAGERRLKEPLQMFRRPGRGDASDAYVYQTDDAARAHIMPSGLSARGSVMWQPIDVKADASPWVERRWISEQMIELWGR
jgi:hypothetical protein